METEKEVKEHIFAELDTIKEKTINTKDLVNYIKNNFYITLNSEWDCLFYGEIDLEDLIDFLRKI